MLSSTTTTNRLKISPQKLKEISHQWQIIELALFGSVLREDFHENSDIDFLITFAPNAPQSLFTLATIKHQLEALLNRNVDLIVKDAISQSENWIRRQTILNTAVTIYKTRI